MQQLFQNNNNSLELYKWKRNQLWRICRCSFVCQIL